MNREPLDHKFQMMMSKSEIKAIDDWMFANRIKSRAKAIRTLCQMSLNTPAVRLKRAAIEMRNLLEAEGK